jgi:hypothetical protein
MYCSTKAICWTGLRCSIPRHSLSAVVVALSRRLLPDSFPAPQFNGEPEKIQRKTKMQAAATGHLTMLLYIQICRFGCAVRCRSSLMSTARCCSRIVAGNKRGWVRRHRHAFIPLCFSVLVLELPCKGRVHDVLPAGVSFSACSC